MSVPGRQAAGDLRENPRLSDDGRERAAPVACPHPPCAYEVRSGENVVRVEFATYADLLDYLEKANLGPFA